jgi:hypothetical protein
MRVVTLEGGLMVWCVEDAGSKNGTFVNWEKIERGEAHALLHGDVVSFGGNGPEEDEWDEAYSYMCVWGTDAVEEVEMQEGDRGRLECAQRLSLALRLAPGEADERERYLQRLSKAACRAWIRREPLDVPTSVLQSLFRPMLPSSATARACSTEQVADGTAKSAPPLNSMPRFSPRVKRAPTDTKRITADTMYQVRRRPIKSIDICPV